jgi:GMP synthase-like glutamine amidotransferase
MKVGILQTGRPPGDLGERFGDYPAMFATLLGEGFHFDTFDVEAGKLPREPVDYDAYLITGSPAGVYDPLPWIGPLAEFIRSTGERKMVGVCFGHQMMAEALGGSVEKSERGWGIGLHRYRIERVEPWMEPAESIAVPISHQDQVVAQPPNTRVFAASAFAPYAALAWTDRPAMSVQFHPEFEPEFAKALIEYRRDRLPNADAAIASLDGPNDRQRVGGWIRNFLNSNADGD